MKVRCNKHAFTLSELLVVIGIIGILFALVVPALGIARRHAQRTKCLSNLRQIAQATMVYVTNHRRLPVGSMMINWPTNDPPTTAQFDALPLPFFESLLQQTTTLDLKKIQPWSEVTKNVHTAKILLCPNDELESKSVDEQVSQFVYAYTSSRPTLFDSHRKNVVSYEVNYGLVNTTSRTELQDKWYNGNPSKVKRPTSMVLCGEGMGIGEFKHTWVPDVQFPEKSLTFADVYKGNGVMQYSELRTINPFDMKRHGGKSNFVFLDGHAETVTINEKDLSQYDLLQER